MTDATEPVPLMRADDDEVRTIFASHLDEVRVRTAPASLDTRAHPARAERWSPPQKLVDPSAMRVGGALVKNEDHLLLGFGVHDCGLPARHLPKMRQRKSCSCSAAAMSAEGMVPAL